MRATGRASGVVALAAALVLAILGVAPSTANAAEDFYDTPATLPASNGDLVRQEPSSFYLDPLKALKVDADVRRIMYRSTDARDKPIAVTGTVLTPKSPWVGKGERPLVGYAVGTQGLGDHCAPSRQLAAGSEYEGAFLKGLLARGYAVAVTDYEGLGTEGVHTYVVRASQGHAVLDAVRAAQRAGIPGLPANGPVGISGYSQGGGASAAAAELAPTYAPELNIKGAYAGAVPADLKAVSQNIDGGLYTGFAIFAVNGITEAYDIDIDPLLTPAGRLKVEAAKEQCTADGVTANAFAQTDQFTVSGKKLSELIDEPQFKDIVAEQTIGVGRAPKVPVLVGQSLLDDVIPYAQDKAMAKRWCGQGTNVRFRTSAAPTHVGAAAALFPAAFAFLEARFAGVPATSNCSTL